MKKTITPLLLLLISFGTKAQNPTFEWVQGIEILGTNLSNSSCEDVVVDHQGNVISAGYFTGNFIDFDTDPTPGVVTHLNAGSSQASYLQKLDSDGNFVWAISFENTNFYNRLFSVDVDAAGNIYCAGFFTGTVDFNPGVGEFELTSAGGADAFIVKLNADGTFGWAKKFTGSSNVSAHSVMLDAAGNITLCGVFEGTVDFDPTANTSNVTSISYSDMFVAKLDAAGDLIWVKQIGSTTPGSGHEEELEHTVDNNGNILVTGWFYLTLDFDPGPNIFNLTNNGAEDAFILKLDPNGDFVWAKQVGANGSGGRVTGQGIDTDATNSVYVTGIFNSNTDFDPGVGLAQLPGNSDDTFILKLDANGDFQWVREIVGADEEYGNGIAVAPDGTSYTIGGFNNTPDFDGTVNVFTLSAESLVFQDVYILKLDTDGNFVWAGDMGSRAEDYGTAIHLDDNGNLTAIGLYQEPADVNAPILDFDPGPGEATIFSTSQDPQGLFVVKLSQNTNPVGIEPTTEELSLNVYPNPVSEQLTIESDEIIESIALIDVTGKTVRAFSGGSNRIDVSALESGVYLLQVQTAKGIASKRLMKK